jgi:uncharacterized delta-60 repeat protein
MMHLAMYNLLKSMTPLVPKLVLSGPLLAILLFPSTAPAATAIEAWTQRYNGLLTSRDEAYKVACDADGDVIVAGYTDDAVFGGDILVIKYSNAGAPLWTNRYNGPTNEEDRPHALAVDANGNVFVAGFSIRNGYWDWITVAYSAAGALLWTNSYSGPLDWWDDSAQALAVDENGNIFVAGYSGADYLTLAYSNAGVPLWTNRCGVGTMSTPTAMAVDRLGHVVVTGYAYTSTGSRDFATVAYSTGGLPLWTNRYSGPGNYDMAQAVAVDDQGNVFVTGGSLSQTYNGYSAYATVAYSAAGAPLWTNRYDRSEEGVPGDNSPRALAVDGNGNVFVTGQSPMPRSPGPGLAQKTFCYATVAYSRAGIPLWTNLYNNLGSNGSASAIVVDRSGNVLVTGSSLAEPPPEPATIKFTTIKYSAAGLPLWTNSSTGLAGRTYSAQDLAVDAKGRVFVTGSSYDPRSATSDGVTAAYSETGTSLWVDFYDGRANGLDSAVAMVVDGSGNVIVTGASDGGDVSRDYTTLKYSSTGEMLWIRRYSDTPKKYAMPRGAAVDGNGNVFVTGLSQGTNYSFYATVAYSSGGLSLWTNYYGGTSGGNPRAVAVDANGNVFVTGTSAGVDTADDYATVAYTGTGVPLWTNRYATIRPDVAQALAVGPNGNVVVTGYSMASNYTPDYVTVAYSGAGVPLWTNMYNGPTGGDDYPKAVAIDGADNAIITGTSAPDSATIKYSSSGTPLWTNRFQGLATALAVDNTGKVIVTGSVNNGSSYDYATVAYSGEGLPLWTNIYGGPGTSDDRATAVGVDGAGNVFVTGYGGTLDVDFVTIAYSSSGVPLWTNRYNGPAAGRDQPCGLAVASNGELIVAGSSDGAYSGRVVYDYAVVKYSMPPSIVGFDKWSASRFQFSSAGMPGRLYVTEFATNLTGGAWFDLGTNMADLNGLWTVTDFAATNAQRFYRTRTP